MDIELINAPIRKKNYKQEIIDKSVSAVDMAKTICLGLNPELKGVDETDIETVCRPPSLGRRFGVFAARTEDTTAMVSL